MPLSSTWKCPGALGSLSSAAGSSQQRDISPAACRSRPLSFLPHLPPPPPTPTMLQVAVAGAFVAAAEAVHRLAMKKEVRACFYGPGGLVCGICSPLGTQLRPSARERGQGCAASTVEPAARPPRPQCGTGRRSKRRRAGRRDWEAGAPGAAASSRAFAHPWGATDLALPTLVRRPRPEPPRFVLARCVARAGRGCDHHSHPPAGPRSRHRHRRPRLPPSPPGTVCCTTTTLLFPPCLVSAGPSACAAAAWAPCAVACSRGPCPTFDT